MSVYALPELLFPENGYVFDTYTDIQKEFIGRIRKDGTQDALVWLKKIKNDREMSYPATITFEWTDIDLGEYKFEISVFRDFSSSMKYNVNLNKLELGNFEVGVKYFWRVNNGTPNSFVTLPDRFRFLKIDGLHNVRDIGGNKIKQGLIFRGSELERSFEITDEGRKTFLDELKIRCEIDLRGDYLGMIDKSSASDEVKLIQLPYRPYKEAFYDEHKEGLCRIMEVLSDEKNYPVYIHCMGGADRTGMIAFFLRAIAGEEDEIIHLDYEMTGLSNYAAGASEGADGFRNRKSDYYVEFLDGISGFAPEKPIRVCAVEFMKECGVSDDCIEKIRNIIKL